MKIKSVCEVGGYIGMILVHASTIPLIISLIMNTATNVPPTSMLLMIISGLFLFLIQSIATKNKLYIISNGSGLVLQLITLSLILIKT